MLASDLAPLRDPDRLAALHASGLLDTAPEEGFDRLTRLAARVVGAPIALISLLDDRRQFFKSLIGLGDPWLVDREVPLSHSVCKYVVARAEPLHFADLREDARFRHDELLRDMHFVAYAGAPLTLFGQTLGTLCVIDHQPREWSTEETELLQELAATVASQIHARRQRIAAAGPDPVALHGGAWFRALVEGSADLHHVTDRENRIVYINPAARHVLGREPGEMIGKQAEEFVHPEDREATKQLMAQALSNPYALHQLELRVAHRDGSWRTLRTTGRVIHNTEGSPFALVNSRDVTEGRAAEQALAAAERRFRQLTELSLVGICLIQGDRIVYANPEFFRIFGYPGDDPAVFPPSMELVAPEDRDRLAELARQRQEGRITTPSAEIRTRRPNGETLSLEARWTAMELAGEGALLATVLDVTQHALAEAALRESEERYRLVARATNEVVWDLDIARGEVAWNELGPRLFGYPPGEVGADIAWHYNHLHPEDRERVVQGTQAVMAGSGGMWSDEYRFRRGDGSYATVLDRAFVVRDERGIPVRMIGSMMDLTERRRAEDAQRFLARISTLLDASLDYGATLVNVARAAVPELADYCLIDELLESGELRRVATAHRDPQRESLLRQTDSVPADAALDPHPVLRAVRSGHPVLVQRVDDVERERLALDNAHREGLRTLGLRSYIVVPMKARNRTLGTITLAAAESGRCYSAADLVQAEELARRAALAVDNARLYREARAAVRARDEVLAVVSHDLRNPLGAITMAASLLLEMGPEFRRDDTDTLERILRAASQMEVLIRDLLDVSRMESGHFAVQPTPQQPQVLTGGAVEGVAQRAEAKRISLAQRLADNLPSVQADRNRVLQVFSNLLGNALKFTPEGGSIVLSADPEPGAVRFSVTDTGGGIPPEQLPYLWDRFWQADGADQRGAGLGLAIVRGIVEAHGGEIGVRSEPGEGSTFWFTLPAVLPPA